MLYLLLGNPPSADLFPTVGTHREFQLLRFTTIRQLIFHCCIRWEILGLCTLFVPKFRKPLTIKYNYFLYWQISANPVSSTPVHTTVAGFFLYNWMLDFLWQQHYPSEKPVEFRLIPCFAAVP